jgi:hypothetical protein
MGGGRLGFGEKISQIYSRMPTDARESSLDTFKKTISTSSIHKKPLPEYHRQGLFVEKK